MKNTLKPWHFVCLGMVALIVIVLMIRGLWLEYRSSQTIAELTASRVQSDLQLGRAQSRLVSLQTALQQMEQSHLEDVQRLELKTQEVVNLEASLRSKGEGKLVVKWETKVVSKEKIVYLSGPEDDPKVHEIKSLPFAFQDWRLSVQGDAITEDFSYELTQKFRGSLSRAITGDGQSVFYVSLYELDKEGQDLVKLELTELDVLQVDYPEERFFVWAPHIDICLVGGLNLDVKLHAVAEVGMSFMAYGLTPDDNTWRFLRVSGGICGSECGAVGFMPISYNIGKQLPLLSDLFIGPMAHWIFPQNSYGFGIGFGSTL